MTDPRLPPLSLLMRGVEIHELPDVLASTRTIKRPHTRRRQLIRRWRHRMAALRKPAEILVVGDVIYATRAAIEKIKAGSITHVSMGFKP